MEYDIAFAEDAKTLKADVEFLCSEGWKPQGGAFYTDQFGDGLWAQAMIREPVKAALPKFRRETAYQTVGVG